MLSLTVDDELELVFPTEDGLEESYSLIMANYDHLRPWTHWLNEDFSLDKVREFYQRNVQKFESGDQIHLRIIFKGEIVGGIDLFEISSTPPFGRDRLLVIERPHWTRACDTVGNQAAGTRV